MNEPSRDDILKAAAGDNASALEFLRAFARRAHWIDDLADRDTPASGRAEGAAGMTVLGPAPASLAEHEQEWLICIAANPFFQQHRGQLVPAMVLALNAWVDSERLEWDSTDIRDVLKSKWHDVVWLVAWLTGGWLKLSQVTAEFRAFDLEPERESIVGIIEKESNGMPG